MQILPILMPLSMTAMAFDQFHRGQELYSTSASYHVAWRACLELSSAALCARLRGIADCGRNGRNMEHHLTSLDIS